MARNPFDELSSLFERMSDQLESEQWPYSISDWPPARSPSLDVLETDDEYVVTVDLPGYEKDDVNVRVTDHTLAIDAEHAEHEETEDERYLRRERSHRSVHREVRLPDRVDPDGVTATMNHGVLTVTVPRSEPTETSHLIEVQ